MAATSSRDALAQLLERIQYADQIGLDTFGIGEHYREEFLDSAPVVILAAAAARTSQIRLTSAVSVLSTADPVRLFQSFATMDLISDGRAEIVVGRGSSIESFLSSAWILAITTHFLLKSSNSCSHSVRPKLSTGRASFARPSLTSRSTHGRCSRNCPSGSALEAPRRHSYGLDSWDCH